jgi:hypothetical protein
LGTKKIDTSLKIYDGISNLLKVSIPPELAKKYASFATEMYVYIHNRPVLQGALEGIKSGYEVGKGGADYVLVKRLATNAASGGFGSAAKLASKSRVAASGPIAAFVDVFSALAKVFNIKINECAIAVTKVMLDILATIALAETVVGIWAAALQCLATGADTKDMVEACLGAG